MTARTTPSGDDALRRIQSAPINFYTWNANCMKEDPENPECSIQLVGLRPVNSVSTRGETVILTFRNICPISFLQLPEWDKTGSPWTEEAALRLADAVAKSAGITPAEREFVPSNTLFYYQLTQFPMIRMQFHCERDRKTITRFLDASAATPTTTAAPGGGPPTRPPRGRYYGKEFDHYPVIRIWESDITVLDNFLVEFDLYFGKWYEITPGAHPGWNIEFKSKDNLKTADFTNDEWIFCRRLNDPRRPASWKSIIRPYTGPPLIVLPEVLSFDIEVYTNRHEAMPNLATGEHAITMISCVSGNLGDPERTSRVLITQSHESVTVEGIQDAYRSEYQRATGASSTPSEHVPEVELIEVSCERDLLLAFARHVAAVSPNIIIGYNIYGFDIPYIQERYQRLCSLDGLWPPEFGGSRVDKVSVRDLNLKRDHRDSTSLKRPLGFAMSTRMDCDVIELVRSNYQLPKYDLKSVAAKFCPALTQKHDVTPVEMFQTHEEAVSTWSAVQSGSLSATDPRRTVAIQKSSRVAAYAIQDADVTAEVFKELKLWFSTLELAAVTGMVPEDTYKSGQQQRIKRMLFRAARSEGVVLDCRLPVTRRWRDNDPTVDDENAAVVPSSSKQLPDHVIPYRGAFVADPTIGVHKNIITLDYKSMYPTILCAFNTCPSTLICQPKPLEEKAFSGVMARIDRTTLAPDSAKYQKISYGRSTAQPVKGCQTITAYVDWGAASTAATAASAATAEGAEEESPAADDGGGGEDGTTKTESPHDPYLAALASQRALETSPTTVAYKSTFVPATVKEGIFPKIVRRLLELRESIRMELAALKAEDRAVVPATDTEIARKRRKLWMEMLNIKQNAVKIMTNAIYGAFGEQMFSKYSCVEVAMSITALGVEFILQVYRYVVEKYNGKIRYGDTDSCMFELPDHITAPSQCHAIGERIAAEISLTLPPPMKLEYEKAAGVIMFLGKKMYASFLLEPDGRLQPVMFTKGIVLARRDKCKLLTTVYAELLQHILRTDHDVVGAWTILATFLIKAFRNEFPVEQFEIIKEMGSNYKQANYNMAVFRNWCLSQGIPSQSGDRMGYLIVTTPSSVPPVGSGIKLDNIGLRMRTTEWWQDQPAASRAPLDVRYYLTNLCTNALDQLFLVAYSSWLTTTGIAETFVHRPRGDIKYSCIRPLTMIFQMIASVERKRATGAKKRTRSSLADGTDVASAMMTTSPTAQLLSSDEIVQLIQGVSTEFIKAVTTAAAGAAAAGC